MRREIPRKKKECQIETYIMKLLIGKKKILILFLLSVATVFQLGSFIIDTKNNLKKNITTN